MIKNDPKEVVFLKSGGMDERWFKDCSDENLLKLCGREGQIIDHVQWKDGEHLADHLHIYFKDDNKETLLSKIKWIPLDENGIQKRHEKIYEWQVKANFAINQIKSSDSMDYSILESLLSSLVRKTSAEKTLEVVQEISNVLNLPNPAIQFCTESCLARTFGIKHIVSITLICFVPKTPSNYGYKKMNYPNWGKLYYENHKVWTNRKVKEGEYF